MSLSGGQTERPEPSCVAELLAIVTSLVHELTKKGETNVSFENPADNVTLPPGATTGPRLVLGPDLPASLTSYGAPDTTWYAAMLWYFNTTDYYFIASGHQDNPGPTSDPDFVAKGTYRSGLEGITVHEYLRTEGNVGALYGDPLTALIFTYQNCEIHYESNSFIRFSGLGGIKLSQQSIEAGDPNSVVNAVETWHPITFANGWANAGGSQVTGQYRRVASPPNSVQLVGELAAGTKADNTLIGTMAAGYAPLKTTTFAVACNPRPAGTLDPLLQVNSAGEIRVYGLVAGTTTLYLSAIIPLDA